MNGGFSLLAWSWFAETTARRAGNHTAVAFAIFAAASKLALAVAGLTVGFLLSIMDYRATQAADLPVAMTVSGTVAAALCLTAAAFTSLADDWAPLVMLSPAVRSQGSDVTKRIRPFGQFRMTGSR